MTRPLQPPEIEEIARRLEDRALAGRNARLLPGTARIAALGLRRVARPPRREDIVKIICGIKRCELRNSCYVCLGKANEIMRLLAGD